MAEKKISELNQLVTPATDDELVIVDTSEVETKRITFEDLADAVTAPSHASEHENGGGDEINLAGMTGLLATRQDAGLIQGIPMITATPSDGDVIAYNAVDDTWEPLTTTLSSALPFNNGRLTLTSGAPVVLGSVSAAIRLYLAQYNGNRKILKYADAWRLYEFDEHYIDTTHSQNGTLVNGSAVVTALSDARNITVGAEVTGTGVPGSTTVLSVDSDTQVTLSANATADGVQSLAFKLPANTVYDVFNYYDGSEVKLELCEWASSSARATSIELINGLYLKQGDNSRAYAGTIYTTGTAGQMADGAYDRFVWNYHNRVSRLLYAYNTNGSFSSSASAWREYNGGSGQIRGEFVMGVIDANPIAYNYGYMGTQAAGTSYTSVAINSTTSGVLHRTQSRTSDFMYSGQLGLSGPVGAAAGYNYLTQIEYAGVNTTYYGGSTSYGAKLAIEG